MPGRDDEGNDPWDDGYTGGHDDTAGGYDEDPPWTEEDERRYQARRREELKRVRRRRRQATSFTALVLLVLGIGLGAAGVYQGWWEWPFGEQEAAAPTSTGPPCPSPEVTAAPPAEVTVTVLNGKGEVGLAGTTAAELEARGFVIGTVDNAEAAVAEVAQVRHGPEAALQARTVAAQVPGAIVVNDGRAGTAVDLALGAGFEGLAPPEEAAAAIAPVPAESPAGCVPAVTPSEPPPATPPSETAPTTPAPTTTAPATTGG